MKIQKRAVSAHHHNTVGYKISNRWYTKNEALKLARKGKIEDVVVVSGYHGDYLRCKIDRRRIHSLPTQVATM